LAGTESDHIDQVGRKQPLGRREILKGLALAGIAGAGKVLAEPRLEETTASRPVGTCIPRVEQWGLQEIVLHSDHEYENEFKAVQLQCTFTTTGKSVTADGFFDDNSRWLIRFMPDTQGHWTFRTKSNDSLLSGVTGEFEVTAPKQGNRGPVSVTNQFHFSLADGTPFYPLGTTTYLLFHQDREIQLRTFATLSRTAFNKVRIFVMPFSSLLPGEAPFARTADGKFDYDRYNPGFFGRYESGLRDLQVLGIEADLILFHPYDIKGEFSRLSREQDEGYIRYAVARLSAYRNVWWTLTNEFDLYPQFGIHKDWRALGELLEMSDPYRHLRGIHNSCVGFYDNSESWITHVILQDITLQRLTPVPRNNSAMSLDARKVGKPVVVDEYGYEGDIAMTWGSLAPREAVEMHWSIVMGGAYGSHGETYFGTPPGDFVGEAPERLAFLKGIMTQTDFQKLVPLPEVMSGQDPAVTVLGTPGLCYIFHFDQPKEVASWNLGFFGPATPSHPLPIKSGAVNPNTFSKPAPQFTIADGVYRVEVIDTWQMKVHHAGFTSGPSQQFRSPVEPGIVRLTRAEAAPAEEKVLPMSELLRRLSPF